MNISRILKVLSLSFLLIVIASLCTAASKVEKDTSVDTSIKNDMVTLYGEIDDSKAYEVITKLHTLQKVDISKPILLLIDSPGGSVDSGLRIIDAMQVSARPVYTVVIGEAASMAAYIHSYGVKRYMFPRAELMYHMASAGLIGEINKSVQKLNFINKIVDDLDNNICKRSAIVTIEQLRAHKSEEWYVTADEALKLHLVDKIINLNDFPMSGKPTAPTKWPELPHK